jgi:hypothetical protein
MIMTLLLIWLGVGIVIMLIGVQAGRYSAGLPLAYFLQLSLIHAPGAAVYINFPKWDALASQTEAGFQQTVIGMVAFLVGVLFVRYTTFASRPAQKPKDLQPGELVALDRLALRYLFGGITYFALGSFVSIPSVGAIIASLSSLLIVGASLRMWVAHQEGNSFKFWLTVSLLPLLPLITIIRGGFIGFGTYWLLASASFAFAQSRRRLGYFIAAPFVVYFGLSIFVNYMASRTEFRQAVWYQQVGFGDRFQRVADMFRNFEWYDSENSTHRDVIDGRLNQNLLVGTAIERLQTGLVDYAYGSTLVDMAIGLIPRALWPNKPQVGGGGTVVQDFTGLKFADGTSVGAGQVLEFYANFGTLGIIGGFLLYGWLIGWMDIRIIDCLYEGNRKGFILWFMICAAMDQPGGNLLEVVVTAAGSAITAYVIGLFLSNRLPARTNSNNSQPTLTAP